MRHLVEALNACQRFGKDGGRIFIGRIHEWIISLILWFLPFQLTASGKGCSGFP
jgi:hypothetical protein